MSTTVKELAEAVKDAATEISDAGTGYIKFANGNIIQSIVVTQTLSLAANKDTTILVNLPARFSSTDYAVTAGFCMWQGNWENLRMNAINRWSQDINLCVYNDSPVAFSGEIAISIIAFGK